MPNNLNLVSLTPQGAAQVAALFRASVAHYAANQDEFALLLNAVAQKLELPQQVEFNQPKINRLCHLGEKGGNKTLSRHYLQCWIPFLPYDLEEMEEIAAGKIDVPSLKDLVFPGLPSELRFLRKKKYSATPPLRLYSFIQRIIIACEDKTRGAT